MKRYCLFFALIVLCIQSCEAIIALDNKLSMVISNKKGQFCTDDYSIEIVPSCSWDDSFEVRDSCRLVIKDLNNPSLIDTLVFIPSLYDKELKIEILENKTWIIESSGQYKFSTNRLPVNNGLVDSKNKIVKEVIFVRVFPSNIDLAYYKTDSEPPYYPVFRFDSRGKRGARMNNIKHGPSARIGDRLIQWNHSDFYNYAILSNNGIATDTLRWWRLTRDWNNWSFIMVGDTIVIEGELAARPSCTSELVIRSISDLNEQYSLRAPRWKQYLTTTSDSAYPVTYVKFEDIGSLARREVIMVSTLYLPSSPTIGNNIKEEFYKMHIYMAE